MSLRLFVIGCLAALFAIVLIGGGILVPLVMPAKLAPEVYSQQSLTKEDSDKIHLQIDVRKAVLDWVQIVFTATTAAGLIVTLFYTARNFRIASENLRVTEYSKFSEAYFKSVELLGNDNRNTVIGTIRALGRLAANSREDHDYVVTSLCEYVRQVAPHRINANGQPAVVPAEIKPEVQAVLNVLRTRRTDWENAQNAPNLSGTCLSGGDLVGANLRYASLEDCNLRGINLRGANLQYAKLSRTLLNSATLDGSDLRNANLQHADLDSARLVSVKLKGTKLDGAHGTVTATNTSLSREQKRLPGLQWI